MGDDGYSATELRRRYHMGGDLKDDNLSAPQLRARYGIRRNTAGASKIGGRRAPTASECSLGVSDEQHLECV